MSAARPTNTTTATTAKVKYDVSTPLIDHRGSNMVASLQLARVPEGRKRRSSKLANVTTYFVLLAPSMATIDGKTINGHVAMNQQATHHKPGSVTSISANTMRNGAAEIAMISHRAFRDEIRAA